MAGNPLAREFTQKLFKLHRLADLVEDTLVERSVALESELRDAAATLPDDERLDLFEHYSDDFFELSAHFPTTLRFAVLIAADTACEVFLNDICKAFQDSNAQSIHLSDLRGAGIEKARTYLKKVVLVEFPDGDPAWVKVRHLHQVRNSIIHADGIVRPNEQELRTWSGSMPGLTISAGGTITLERQFTTAAIDAYEDFSAVMDLRTGGMGLWNEFPFIEA
jgi:hypothetical protein